MLFKGTNYGFPAKAADDTVPSFLSTPVSARSERE